MSRADGSIIIDTKIDDAELSKGISRIQTAGSKAAGVLGTAFGGISAAVSVAAAAIGGFALASIQGAEEDAAWSRQLLATTESMGIFGDQADDVADRLDDLAGKQQYLIGVDENVIKASQAKLLTFKNLAASADDMGGAFDRATQLTLDLAAKGFGSAESNAVSLGKALEDPVKGITALNRQGINFSETERAMIKDMVAANRTLEAQDFILSAIEKQVAGSAKAAMKASDQIKIAMGEVGDAFGTALLPLVNVLAPAINKFLYELQPLLGDLGTSIANFIMGTGSEQQVAIAAQNLGDFLSKAIDKAAPTIALAVDALLLSVSQMLPQMVTSIGTLASAIVGALADSLPLYIQSIIDAMLGLITTLAQRSSEWLTPLTTAALDIITLIITELMKSENIMALVEVGLELGGAIGRGLTIAALGWVPIVGKNLRANALAETPMPVKAPTGYQMPTPNSAALLSSTAGYVPSTATAPAPSTTGAFTIPSAVNITNNFNAPQTSYAQTASATSVGSWKTLAAMGR